MTRPGTLESSIERVLSELRREYWRAIESPPANEPMPEQVLILRSGGARLALYAAQAREVARLGDLVPLPGAPSRLAGVTSVRGQVLPVLDLRQVMEGLASERSGAARLVTLRGKRPVALLVEAVDDLLEVSLEQLLLAADQPIRDADAQGRGGMPCRGEIRLEDGGAVALLDVARLTDLATEEAGA
jgi:purine-binding chemotaxis protein CheW